MRNQLFLQLPSQQARNTGCVDAETALHRTTAATTSKGMQAELLARHVNAGGGIMGTTINTNKSKHDVDNNSKSLNRTLVHRCH